MSNSWSEFSEICLNLRKGRVRGSILGKIVMKMEPNNFGAGDICSKIEFVPPLTVR